MKKILIISLFIFLYHTALSQNHLDSTIFEKKNTITIKDSRIDKLNKSYFDSFRLKGFRVQIYSGIKRQPANQARSTFLRDHPKTKAHLNYEQPYYKVRVGDFKTKLEALKYKSGITNKFPFCFIVQDEIDINELVD